MEQGKTLTKAIHMKDKFKLALKRGIQRGKRAKTNQQYFLPLYEMALNDKDTHQLIIEIQKEVLVKTILLDLSIGVILEKIGK